METDLSAVVRAFKLETPFLWADEPEDASADADETVTMTVEDALRAYGIVIASEFTLRSRPGPATMFEHLKELVLMRMNGQLRASTVESADDYVPRHAATWISRAFKCRHIPTFTSSTCTFERESPVLLTSVADVFEIKAMGTAQAVEPRTVWVNPRIGIMVSVTAAMSALGPRFASGPASASRSIHLIVHNVQHTADVRFMGEVMSMVMGAFVPGVALVLMFTVAEGCAVVVPEMYTGTVRYVQISASGPNSIPAMIEMSTSMATHMIVTSFSALSPQHAHDLVRANPSVNFCIPVALDLFADISASAWKTITLRHTLVPALFADPNEPVVLTMPWEPSMTTDTNTLAIMGAIRFYNRTMRRCSVGRVCFECAHVCAMASITNISVRVPRDLNMVVHEDVLVERPCLAEMS